MPLFCRGYNVLDEELEMTAEQFTEKYGASPSREALTILVAKLEDATDRLLVYFPEGDLGVKQTRP
jgi:RNA polymerase Rpb5, N-terminal domain